MYGLPWRLVLMCMVVLFVSAAAPGCDRTADDSTPMVTSEGSGAVDDEGESAEAPAPADLDLAVAPWDGPAAPADFDAGLAMLDVRAALRMMQADEPCAITVSPNTTGGAVGPGRSAQTSTGHVQATPERVIVLRPNEPTEGRAVRTGTYWGDAGRIEQICREDLCAGCGAATCRSLSWTDDGRFVALTLRNPGEEDRVQRVSYDAGGVVRILEAGEDGIDVEASVGTLVDGRLAHITASGIRLGVRYNEGGFPIEVVREGGVVVTAMDWDALGRLRSLRMQGHAGGFRYVETWEYECASPSPLVVPRALTDEEAALLPASRDGLAELCVTESPLFDTRFVHACDALPEDEGAVIGVIRGEQYTPRVDCAAVASEIYIEHRAAGGNSRGRAQVAANAVRFTCLGGRRPDSVDSVDYVHVIRGRLADEAWAFDDQGAPVPLPE